MPVVITYYDEKENSFFTRYRDLTGKEIKEVSCEGIERRMTKYETDYCIITFDEFESEDNGPYKHYSVKYKLQDPSDVSMALFRQDLFNIFKSYHDWNDDETDAKMKEFEAKGMFGQDYPWLELFTLDEGIIKSRY